MQTPNPNVPANKGQTFAIYCALKFDVRSCVLTHADAHNLLQLANTDKAAALACVALIPGAIQKGKANATPSAAKVTGAKDYAAIWKEGCAAGLKAGNEALCEPMHVVQRANMLDDSSAIVKRYEPVMDGVCGFASVVITPATSGFCKWLKAKGHADKHYYGGYSIFIGEHRQSLTRKEAHARAMAEVFSKYGYSARCHSRID